MSDRLGRFEAAEGGTLFLDEVGELPLSIQAKLRKLNVGFTSAQKNFCRADS